MLYQIEVFNKAGFKDSHAEHVKHDIHNLNLKQQINVKYLPLYQIEGDLNLRELNTVVKELLIDPITQESTINVMAADSTQIQKGNAGYFSVEVWFKYGVTDTVAESVVKAVKDLGINKDMVVRTGHKYVLSGKLTSELVKQISEKLLANTMVQKYTIRS